MKLCDLTQFYSPVSGGVKRYLSEKVRYIREQTNGDEHVLIIPGERDEMIVEDRARIYTIRSPLVSRTARYRVILRLEAIEEILMRERPDLIECGDPYQVAWKAVHSGTALRIPVVGFYHSHFPEAYVRTAQKFCGPLITEMFLDFSRRYIRALYNRFQRTLVPSPGLADLLRSWGVKNLANTDLGVDTAVFHPANGDRHSAKGDRSGAELRERLGIATGRTLLLYVGRLAQEKNTQTLFAAYRLLARQSPDKFHLMIIGDGGQRGQLAELQREVPGVTWRPYCAESAELAAAYRAADLFVHPGVQETFGLVTIEAQACGTPVIGIRGSYMDRIVHSDLALWARENTPEALAEAIERMSREDLPKSGHGASDQVSAKYSWQQVFARMFDLYREVIEDYTPRL